MAAMDRNELTLESGNLVKNRCGNSVTIFMEKPAEREGSLQSEHLTSATETIVTHSLHPANNWYQSKQSRDDWHKTLVRLIRDYKIKHPRMVRKTRFREAVKPVRLIRWKRLSQLERLKRAAAEMPDGARYDFTVHISREVLAAATHHVRGQLDYIYRRMVYYLNAALGRAVDFFVVAEVSPKGRVHLHGMMNFTQGELKSVKSALRKALGAWDTGSIQNQFLFRIDPDVRWVNYSLKDPALRGPTVILTSGLRRKTEAAHEFEVQRLRGDEANSSGPVGHQ